MIQGINLHWYNYLC